jgi:hypothetical protein
MASVEWKKPATLDRVAFEREIIRLLGESESLSEFELRHFAIHEGKHGSDQNQIMFSAALRSMMRRGVILCEGRYRLAQRTGAHEPQGL